MVSQKTWSQATLRSVRDVAEDVRIFEIAPVDGVLPYLVGSHIEVQVMVDGRPETRAFSLVGDGSATDCYRIAVKNRTDGHGGSKYLWSLEPGARVSISAPKDMFTLAYGAPEYLLVAGGIGITPIFGMALALANKDVRFRLLYAARSEAQLAFADELRAAIGDRLVTFVGERGERIDPAGEIARLDPNAELYICGPLGLREAFQRAWAAAERPSATLRFETFASSGRYPAEPFEVEVANRGVRFTVPENQSLLQALVENGVDDVLYDCEHGECGLCTVKVLECTGEIDHRDVFYSDRQRDALRENRICTCVSRVVNGRIVIDTSRQLVDTGELPD